MLADVIPGRGAQWNLYIALTTTGQLVRGLSVLVDEDSSYDEEAVH